MSCDGSWQRRGYSSLNGVVTVISSGKCLDYQVLSKVCNACTLWETKKTTDPDRYDKYVENHSCPINHDGSAVSMEAKNLRYLEYIGDGDSKSYADVVSNDPYPGHTIQKLECVGHIQKRVDLEIWSKEKRVH